MAPSAGLAHKDILSILGVFRYVFQATLKALHSSPHQTVSLISILAVVKLSVLFPIKSPRSFMRRREKTERVEWLVG